MAPLTYLYTPSLHVLGMKINMKWPDLTVLASVMLSLPLVAKDGTQCLQFILTPILGLIIILAVPIDWSTIMLKILHITAWEALRN